MMVDRSLPHPLLLWAGWVLGPVAWGADLAIRYALVPGVCDGLGRGWLLGVGGIAMVVAASGVGIGWHCRRRVTAAGDSNGSAAQLLAGGGIALSAISLLGIALATIMSLGARC